METWRSPYSEDSFPCARPCQTIIKLVCKLLACLVVLVIWIVKQGPVGSTSQVPHGLHVFVNTVANCEYEHVYTNLRVSQVRSHVLPKHIARSDFIYSVLVSPLLWLQLWQLSDEVGDLEKKHAATNVSCNLESTVQSRYDGCLHRSHRLLKVHRKVVEKLANNVVRVI